MDLIRSIGYTLLSWGPWGILVLAVLDSAGIPIPEGVDALLVIIGNMDPKTGYWSAALAVAGSLAGSIFLFEVGRKGGEAFLDERTRTGRARRFRAWFHHYGEITIFIPSLVPAPLPLKVFILCAGALGMKRTHFVLVLLAGRIPRYFGMAYLGARLGKEPLVFLSEHVYELLGIAVALFLFLFLLFLVKFKDWLRARADLRAVR
ncbi:MAG TPA: VTT domain-containing protein [Bryobacteraceae bacterium]|nr:VTT domain-containing protein [Bryobacteraceae bacterium]